jgi:hypothetical protein
MACRRMRLSFRRDNSLRPQHGGVDISQSMSRVYVCLETDTDAVLSELVLLTEQDGGRTRRRRGWP